MAENSFSVDWKVFENTDQWIERPKQSQHNFRSPRQRHPIPPESRFQEFNIDEGPISVDGEVIENTDRRAFNQGSETNDPKLLTPFKNGVQNHSKHPNQIMLRSGRELLPPNG